MRVVVAGSRSFSDLELIHERLKALLVEHGDKLELVHGGASGPDSEAGMFARAYQLPVTVEEAQWEPTPDTPFTRLRRTKSGLVFDAAAGILRNVRMLDMCPDLVLVFWDGVSRGSKHMIDEATRRSIPLEVLSER